MFALEKNAITMLFTFMTNTLSPVDIKNLSWIFMLIESLNFFMVETAG